MGASVAALLCVKEAGVLAFPALALAWHFSGGSWLDFGACLGLAVGFAGVAILALFGDMALPVLKAGSKGHQTPYTKDYQQGAPHRLVVDLFLVSPVTVLAALASHQWWVLGLALTLVATHTLAPVRNVRLVLAAELLLRAAVAATFGWYALPLIAIDLLLTRAMRRVYDPITAALTNSLGMTK